MTKDVAHFYFFIVIIAGRTVVDDWLLSMLMSILSAVLFGKWTDHVKSWRHSELGDRIMYITYEEMVQVVKLDFTLSVSFRVSLFCLQMTSGKYATNCSSQISFFAWTAKKISQ